MAFPDSSAQAPPAGAVCRVPRDLDWGGRREGTASFMMNRSMASTAPMIVRPPLEMAKAMNRSTRLARAWCEGMRGHVGSWGQRGKTWRTNRRAGGSPGTRALGLTSIPGVATVTEAFRALEAGAHALKMFPADVLGVGSLKAWRSVMPADVRFLAVGGIEAGNAAAYLSAGASGVGIGGWLYRPGSTIERVRKSATQLVQALSQAAT